MSTPIKFDVITVNYNSSETLNKLIKSLGLINNYINKIIIIDNNSNDTDRLILNNKIKLIRNSQNLGFAKAVNEGMNVSEKEIVLIINPDCQLKDKSPLKTYAKILTNQNIGAIGGKISHPKTKNKQYTATGSTDFLTGLFEFTNLKKIFPNNFFTNKFWIEKNNNIRTATKVFSVCGAYIFIKNKAGIRFNEQYFLYMEDLDLGYVIKSKNLEVWFDPDSEVLHLGGHSSKSKYNIVLKHWYKSRKIYFLNHSKFALGHVLYILFTIEESLLTLYHHFTKTPNE